MRRSKSFEAVAAIGLATAVSVGAIALPKKSEAIQRVAYEETAYTRDIRVNPILRAAAIADSWMVLRETDEAGKCIEVRPDIRFKNGIFVIVKGEGGKHKYTVILGMRAGKYGEPLPNTTYEVIETEYYGHGPNIESNTSILGPHKLGSIDWNALDQQYSIQDQNRPKSFRNTLQTPTVEEANALASIIKQDANLASVLPSPEVFLGALD